MSSHIASQLSILSIDGNDGTFLETPNNHTSYVITGPLKEDEFNSMFKALTKKSPGSDQRLFKEYLLNINKALAYVHFELRGFINQYDGEIYYGVVNNVSDEQSKLGTKYSVVQIALYKAIIEAIIQDPTAHGTLSSIEALNIKLECQFSARSESESQVGALHVPTALKTFSIAQKEKTINELVLDRWLNTTADGNISLGVRSFLDLRSWFRSNDVPSCEVCNEAGVKAKLCQNEECSVRIHDYCLKQLFSQKKAAKKCPSCGAPWQLLAAKAEYVQKEEEMEEPAERQPPTQNRRKLKRGRNDEGNVSMPSIASTGGSDERSVTRSSAHLS